MREKLYSGGKEGLDDIRAGPDELVLGLLAAAHGELCADGAYFKLSTRLRDSMASNSSPLYMRQTGKCHG